MGLPELVSNPDNFTEEYDEVKVSLQFIDSHFLEIRVRDNGTCMALQQLKQFFESDFKIDINESCQKEGRCIVAALIKAMAGLHHGTLTASSIDGKPMEFKVTLPQAKGHEIDNNGNVIKSSRLSVKSEESIFLEKAISTIKANVDNPDFTIDILAKELHMSVSQLNRKLNLLIDQPAGHLIRAFRLDMAARLLQQKAGTIAEIGYQLGFNDHAYFSRAFKRQFGCSPSEFMND
jgi:AraC-like DNA-binding protein